MDQCCRVLAHTLGLRLPEEDKACVQQWLKASIEEIAREDHAKLPVLAQWGLAEILDHLHTVLHFLVTQDRFTEARDLLVSAQNTPCGNQFWPTACMGLQKYWTMQQMIKRTVRCTSHAYARTF